MREKEYIKQRYAAIFSLTGVILCLAGLLMLLPLLILFYYPQESAIACFFWIPALMIGVLGLLMWWIFRPSHPVTLSIQEGGVIVLIGWSTVILFSALPFLSLQGIDFSRAVFESMSAWTTTGLSVVDVGNVSRMVLIWRSLMQLAGGAGLAVIMMSAITGPVGMGISNAEGRGDQLVPHVRRSARLVLIIYTSYASIGTFAYLMAGMSFFDAINHSFAAVSTGGFSTHVESIGYWDSAAIEAVTVALMLLGSLSFVTAWFLWRGKYRTVIRSGEVHLQIVLIPLVSVLVFLLTCRTIYTFLGKSIRVAVFETVSAITTTGFSTVTYGEWNDFGRFLLVVLMLIGGGTCSTAGGIKQSRVYLLWKLLIWEIRCAFLPRTTVLAPFVWEGNRRTFINDEKIRPVFVFIFLYLGFYLIGTMILCSYGYSLEDSLFEFASALGTVGLSVGVTTANMPNPVLWTQIVAMFLGRLEFFVVIISLLKLGRDGYQMINSIGRNENTSVRWGFRDRGTGFQGR